MKMIYFEVISNLHVQGSKFSKKFDKFGGKSFKNLNSAEFMEFVFSKSGSVVLEVLAHSYPILKFYILES